MYLLKAYVTNASLNVNRPFTYAYDQPVEKYCRVKVLFHNAANTAIVIECTYTEQNKEELKGELGFEIQDIIEPEESGK